MATLEESAQTFVVTGATGFLGRRLIVRLLANDPSAHVIAMARANDPQQADAERHVAVHAPDAGGRVVWSVCDITKSMLGLKDDQIADLARTGELNVLHLAALYDLEVEEALSKRLTLDGAIRAYELARAVRRHPERGDRPVRFCQTSTLAVAGTYDGEFGETGDELARAAGTHTDWYSQHKYEAELALRKLAEPADVPLMIVRPGVAVGDSDTGAIEKLDGPYCLLEYVRWPVMRHFLPTGGAEPFWLVPGDFVVRAMAALAARADAYGHTFNLLYPPDKTPVWPDLVSFTLSVLRSEEYTGGGLAGFAAKLKHGWHLPLPVQALIVMCRMPLLGRPMQALLWGMGVEPHSLYYAVRNPRYVVENYRKFGVEPPPPWRDAWRACMLYYRDHRDEMKAGVRVAHQKDG